MPQIFLKCMPFFSTHFQSSRTGPNISNGEYCRCLLTGFQFLPSSPSSLLPMECSWIKLWLCLSPAWKTSKGILLWAGKKSNILSVPTSFHFATLPGSSLAYILCEQYPVACILPRYVSWSIPFFVMLCIPSASHLCNVINFSTSPFLTCPLKLYLFISKFRKYLLKLEPSFVCASACYCPSLIRASKALQ